MVSMSVINRLLISMVAILPLFADASNTANQSFNKAKKQLVTMYQGHRETLYCGAAFDAKGRVITPPGFTTTTYLARAKKIEWEHVVLRILARLSLSGVRVIVNVLIARVSHSKAASVPRK
jgi:endonuclease I